jgi:hypothetical protein
LLADDQSGHPERLLLLPTDAEQDEDDQWRECRHLGLLEKYVALVFQEDIDSNFDVNNETANRMSLFYAHATPMLKVLSDTTAKFVSDVRVLPQFQKLMLNLQLLEHLLVKIVHLLDFFFVSYFYQ